MKYLKIKTTEEDYIQHNNEYDYPLVTWLKNIQTTTVKFVEKFNYEKNYLTFKAVEDCVFTLTIPSQVTSTHITSISYSVDYGTTWVTTNITSSSQTITTPTILADHKVLWKGVGKTLGVNSYYSKFSSTGKYELFGNIMSLLFGDDFEDKTYFPTSSYSYNFAYLFSNNSKLLDASNLMLPATMCNAYCYRGMFSSCTSLRKAPKLPAVKLSDGCYQFMFNNCRLLRKAPKLPALELVNNCYYQMFTDCINLNYIEALFINNSSTNNTLSWVSGVAGTGTFIKSEEATWDEIGDNGIPTGWVSEIQEYKWPNNYNWLTLEAIVDLTFTLTLPSTLTTANCRYIEYSIDNGATWTRTYNVDSQAVTITTPTISAGNKVYWRGFALKIGGGNTVSDYSNVHCSTFSATNRYNASGNIMSMIGCASELTSGTCMFACLFRNSTTLVSAENLILPATYLYTRSYSMMFENCTRLTTAPRSLKSVKFMTGDAGFGYMFSGCTALVTPPELPLVTASYSYLCMFNNCTSLVTPPEIHIMNLGGQCFNSMFSGCSKLATAPELPATTLVYNCYVSMFQNCTSLTTAPVLPATTLVSNCYKNMFKGCSKINYIKALFTTTPSDTYTMNWVNGVAASGTFVKNSSALWNVTGTNGIPSGWDVTTAASA